MASHHSHGCHHHHTTACCGCYCPPPPPPLPSSCSCYSTTAADPLLHTTALHLLQSTPSHLPQSYQCHHLSPQPPLHQHGNLYKKAEVGVVEDDHRHLTHPVDSLIQRIAALESTLTSPAPHYACQKPLPEPTPPPPPPSSSKRGDPIRLSLRDVAARTIQTGFRLYLVHRSRTLGHLKQLSVIRFQLVSLDPSNPISEHVMDLLLRVDSIQSRDPLIRDVKKSISNELLRILKRRELCVESVGNPSMLEKDKFTSSGTGSQNSNSPEEEEDDESEEDPHEISNGEEEKKNGYNPEQLGLRPPLPFKME